MSERLKRIQPGSLRLLNFGCGTTFHPTWVNLDAASAVPGVIEHNLRHRMPFSDDSFDAAYGSHILEHFDPQGGMRLLYECRRVLRPGGILRLVVPDLEAITRLYLDALEEAKKGDRDSVFRYDWALIELYDQAVRSTSGGRMAAYLSGQLEARQVSFLESRIGAESIDLARGVAAVRRTAVRRHHRRLRAAARAMRRGAAKACAWLFLGREGPAALREGLFRRDGEVHQWMYDRFSLKRLLEQTGFTDVRVCSADESRIPRFTDYELDVRDGRPRKPDSIYLEGLKAGDEPRYQKPQFE
jgi:SAM-dependent methyltransferase